MQFWADREKQALDRGFKGIRITGDGGWAKQEGWAAVNNYEKLADDLIQKLQVQAICSYSSKIAGLPEIISVGMHHSMLIVNKEDKWQIIDTNDMALLLEKIGQD